MRHALSSTAAFLLALSCAASRAEDNAAEQDGSQVVQGGKNESPLGLLVGALCDPRDARKTSSPMRGNSWTYSEF
jgi:hypothetical protein